MEVQAKMGYIMNYFKLLTFNSTQIILFSINVILIALNLLYQQHFVITKKFFHQATDHPLHAQIIFMILLLQFYRNLHFPHLQNRQN
jgi:hypothetical protein